MGFQVISVDIDGRHYEDVVAGFTDLALRFRNSFEIGSQQASPLLLQSLQQVANRMKELHSNPWNGGVVNDSDRLQSRSGAGLQSIIDSVKTQGPSGDLLAVGSISAGSLSVHEVGAVVKATRAQYLTIPLPAALDPRGVPLRARARDWDNTFVRRSRAGNLIIFRKLPGARELTPLYILKDSVTIRPRLGMEPELDTQMGYFETKLWNELSVAIDKYL